jgi:(p)ppGpp synthase/HD superfamily hydrolase
MDVNSKLQEAIEFAVEKHKGQTRKGDGRPYVSHTLSVMTRAYKVKKSTNIAKIGMACVLHDTVEDCDDVEIDEIAERFGYMVASIVEELTLDKSKYETMGKTEYLKEHMTNMSSYALVIKLCDRLDNVEDMHSMNPEFIEEYTQSTREIMEHIKTSRKLTKTHKKLIRQILKALPR